MKTPGNARIHARNQDLHKKRQYRYCTCEREISVVKVVRRTAAQVRPWSAHKGHDRGVSLRRVLVLTALVGDMRGHMWVKVRVRLHGK